MDQIDKQPSLQDVLTAVNTGFTLITQEFDEKLEQKLAEMETRLVTKDYLDDKLYDLRGDLNSLYQASFSSR